MGFLFVLNIIFYKEHTMSFIEIISCVSLVIESIMILLGFTLGVGLNIN